ncbi:N,N-dimethylformamidase beta subunit family domain-containing protein [Roseomonas marmotae]|uniref:N,N-dimethylformamidase n=1 Tax=Roseomonas marmotae TaxID=2768161 RepID=A0ABS3KHV2_9PROT|nr:N,N-dimethylformamidase beta subunit family domain-containing protein [Roseomonas marmotae]MBO1077054.1 N,N-dimethylformamidase [Roseomonas marmotae]QTI82109.1 N,N-dimethylformamidase [Roseomonas marmotae]
MICDYDLLGYPDPLCVRAGETVRIHVSSEDGGTRYRADLVRVICGDETPGGVGLKEELVPGVLGTLHQGRRKSLHIGSYSLLPTPPAAAETAEFTASCRFFPTTPELGRRQVLMARGAGQDGWSLAIDAEGRLEGRVGQTTLRSPTRLLARYWFQATLSWSGGKARLTLRALQRFPAGQCDGDWNAAAAAPAVAGLPLTLAAEASEDAAALPRGVATSHYNGKIEAPCLFTGELAPDARARLFATGLPPRDESSLLGAWDLAEDISGSRVIDTGPHALHGVLVNLPTRGVTSADFDGTVQAWTVRPAHFAAVHFHDDDFEDARWEPDFEIRIPDDLPSGAYAARLTPEGKGPVEHVVFFVAPPRGEGRNPVAFLASTATYMAYATPHYSTDMAEMEPKRGTWMTIGAPEVFVHERRELGLSPYDTHSDGSGVCYSSRLRPLFAMRIRQRLWAFNADTHILEWLHAEGIGYDLITDDHLHAEGPSVLAPYRCVLTGTHPEYWTTRMLDSLEAWQAKGGRLIYLGGNGFYWRVAYHPEKPWLIEVRRAESGARYWETEPGEAYHSFTGEYGGLWRRLGRAPQRVAAAGTIATGFDFSSYYRLTPEARDPRAAWIFEGVEGEIVGNHGLIGGGAAGEEIDCADVKLGTPPHALVVGRSEGHTRYMLLAPEAMTSSIANHSGEENPEVRAELVFHEGPAGGAVFAVGSIAWAHSLPTNGHDNDVAQITRNVVLRFADPTPFPMPPAP